MPNNLFNHSIVTIPFNMLCAQMFADIKDEMPKLTIRLDGTKYLFIK